MTIEERLTAILAAIQTDPVNRGLARVPDRNLFTACAEDFAAACRNVAEHPDPAIDVFTGFMIAAATPPRMETDGPLGAVFLARALIPLGIPVGISIERTAEKPLMAGLAAAGFGQVEVNLWDPSPDPGGRPDRMAHLVPAVKHASRPRSHYLAIERSGPAADGACYTMRGRDISDHMAPVESLFAPSERLARRTIGIGDGGNEIGMGKIAPGIIAANIPQGELIHCTVATDYLVVAGISNWGAYALAAGIALAMGRTLPPELFDPAREKSILEAMVAGGHLVDGVSAQPTATVDGLNWDDYVKPLLQIESIVGKGHV